MSFFTAAETADLDAEIRDLIDAGALITRVTKTVVNGPLGQTETYVDGATFRGFIGAKTLTQRSTTGALVQTTELQLTTAVSVDLDTGEMLQAGGQYYEVQGDTSADSSLAVVATYRVERADVGV